MGITMAVVADDGKIFKDVVGRVLVDMVNFGLAARFSAHAARTVGCEHHLRRQVVRNRNPIAFHWLAVYRITGAERPDAM